MAYTTINKSSDYFNTKLYTGNFTDNTDITGVGFQPDLVWLKERSSGSSNLLQDAVRGANKDLFSDTSSAEESNTNRMKAFISDGFTLGAHNLSNQNGETYASWNWKANGAGSANTAGSISSTVSANTTAGFSIVTFTGNETVDSTVGHGLGAIPKMIIVKGTSFSAPWIVYHHSIGNSNYLRLNTTDAEATANGMWSNTTPTNSVFTLGTDSWGNNNGQSLIAYCFAEKQGYSKFGSYKGNGNANGAFVYTGFSPAFFMLKRTDGTNSWRMWDNKRDPFNVRDTSINANENDAEYTDASVYMDFVSNGVKFRTTGDNVSGGNYIYMAFAEAPLVGTNGVTAKAR